MRLCPWNEAAGQDQVIEPFFEFACLDVSAFLSLGFLRVIGRPNSAYLVWDHVAILVMPLVRSLSGG
jgi:hypothetical protein